MLRPISQLVGLLGIALLVLHRAQILEIPPSSALYADVVAGLFVGLGLAGLLVYAAQGYTGRRRRGDVLRNDELTR